MAALRIVGLGDSTTAGTPGFLSPLEAPPNGRGDVESQYVHWMMQARPDWEALNRGINGQRSDEILARFARDVVGERPDCVIVLAGVNDIYQRRPLEVVQENLGAMYRLALDARIFPVAVSVLPYDLHRQTIADRLRERAPLSARAIRELNAWIASTVRILGIPFCDTNAAAGDPASPDRLLGTPDGLHPDVAGYRRMGEALVQTIEAYQIFRGNPEPSAARKVL
jgi:lysophospholipase L1-like esterase